MAIKTKLTYLSRIFIISSLSLLFLTLVPVFAGIGETPYTQAQYIAQTSQSNPYQTLVYVLALTTGLSIVGMGYLYNQQTNNLKEQFSILRGVSDNMADLTNKIENSNKTIEKSLDIVNVKLADKPCLLNSDIMKDLLKPHGNRN